MKRTITLIVLTCIIILCAAFVSTWALAQGSETNYFNTKVRYRLAKYSIPRLVLNLHSIGDGRYQYLGSKYNTITVTVLNMDGQFIDTDVYKDFSEKIHALTGKDAYVQIISRGLPHTDTVSDEELSLMFSQFRSHVAHLDSPDLYILSLSVKKDEPKLLGLTNQDNGIVLFTGAIKDFTKDTPTVTNSYITSKLLHEFGHQLGLSHTNDATCLMTEHAEQDHVTRTKPEEVITDFCPQEKEQVKQMSELLK